MRTPHRHIRIRELRLVINPGQVVGELGLLAYGQVRTATVECTEAAQVLQISYDQVRQLYLQNPQFGFYFLQLTTRRLFENIASLERQLTERATGGVTTPALPDDRSMSPRDSAPVVGRGQSR